MQDGAPPPHFALLVRAWLDNHFLGRWIGCRGQSEWTPPSPDLTTCDLFLCGRAKNDVYSSKPRTQDELEQQT